MRIRRLTAGELSDDFHALMEAIFGPRRGAREKLEGWASKPSISVLGAWVGDKAVGISVVRVSESDVLSQLFSIFPPDASLVGRKVGDFQTLAVAPECRQQGVAEALSRHQLQWLREQGCNAFMGICWEHGHGGSSAHLFRKGGFRDLGTVEGFYLQGSRDTGHHCPVCQGECRCRATLYALVE